MIVDGSTPLEDRQIAVERFQSDPSIKLFVGNLLAAGVGLTLTASSHVIFGELDWVPGNVTQAEDRTHRIGQTNNVLVQHIVLDGSLDAKMARTLVAKQTVIDQALNDPGDVDVAIPDAVESTDDDEPAKHMVSVRKMQIDKEAQELTPAEISEIHRKLQIIAGMCDGARKEDMVGFNRYDTRMGKELAYADRLTPKQAVLGKALVRKYHRQLGE